MRQMQYDEDGLREILRENPFADVVAKWGEALAQFDHGKIDKCQLQLLVGGDRDWVEKCEREGEEENFKFHFGLIPDVFRGDPRAPVWILLLNPGFSDIDLYDHLGLCPFCEKRLVTAHDSEAKPVCECAHAWMSSDLSNPIDALRFRQEAMLKQLELAVDEESGNYAWFDGRFRTMAPAKREKVGKGGYWWWKEFLFGPERSRAKYLFRECGIREDSETLGRKFFALDAFPYHSKNFNCGIFNRQEYQVSPYFMFWKRLVEWALGSGRKLIVRYKAVLKILKGNIDKQVWEARKDNVYLMPSQMPYLTVNNINIQGPNTKANKRKALDELRAAWLVAEQETTLQRNLNCM